MSDMKCPFCDKPLQPTLRQADEYFCENYDCPKTSIEWVGSKKLWQELITTRKALDIAVDALNTIKGKHDPRCAVYHIDEKTAYEALEQINEITKGNK